MSGNGQAPAPDASNLDGGLGSGLAKLLAIVVAPVALTIISYFGVGTFLKQSPPANLPDAFLGWVVVSVAAIPTFWFCTPIAVFLFFRGAMKFWPHLLGVALVCVFVPGLILSVFAKSHNVTFAFCVLGVAVLNAFLIWWLYKLFERVRRAVVTKALSVIDAYIESPRS